MKKFRISNSELAERSRRGETVAQIAAAGGVSPQAIRKRLERIREAPTPESVTAEILKNMDIKKMTGPQQASILRTLSKGTGGRRNRTPKAPVHFTPIDLSFSRAISCSSCGEYPATEAYPVCIRCRPDTPYDFANDGWIDAGRIVRYVLCEGCGKSNATSRRDNPGKKALCNSCRLSAPVMAVGAEGVAG